MDRRKDIAREIARSYIVLSTDALDELANILVPMKFKRGELVLNENDVCDYMYYVEKGLIRQFCRKDGKEVTEHLSYEDGMVISVESYFRREPARLMIQALEPSVLYGIPYDAIQELTKQSYEFCRLMFAILERSLILSQRKADAVRFYTAKERYLSTLRDSPDIIRRAPLKCVASYLQMTPETLSRVRKAASDSDS